MSLGCPRCGSLITNQHSPGCTFPKSIGGVEVDMTPEELAKARRSYDMLGRREKLMADLRALADGPGPTCDIISLAADELQMAWNAEKEMTKALQWACDNRGAHPENIAKVAMDALAAARRS